MELYWIAFRLVSSGSIGFRPLESKMIRVHAPAFCIKEIKKFIDNEGSLPVVSGTYGNIFFYRYFALRGAAMVSARSSEVHRSFISQVSV